MKLKKTTVAWTQKKNRKLARIKKNIYEYLSFLCSVCFHHSEKKMFLVTVSPISASPWSRQDKNKIKNWIFFLFSHLYERDGEQSGYIHASYTLVVYSQVSRFSALCHLPHSCSMCNVCTVTEAIRSNCNFQTDNEVKQLLRVFALFHGFVSSRKVIMNDFPGIICLELVESFTALYYFVCMNLFSISYSWLFSSHFISLSYNI